MLYSLASADITSDLLTDQQATHTNVTVRSRQCLAAETGWRSEMQYDVKLPDGQREQFSSYYYKYVALGEGCGCAEQILARRSGSGFFIGVISTLLHRWRYRSTLRRGE